MDIKKFLDKDGLNYLNQKIDSNFLNKSNIHLSINVINENKADIDSPNFIGVPTAPTANLSDSSNQIATTGFVQDLVSNSSIYLSKIIIVKEPNKMIYVEGEKFDPEGMKIIGIINNKYYYEIEDYDYFPKEELTYKDTYITFSYSINGVKKTCQLEITNKTYLLWGINEDKEGDADWWAELKTNVENMSEIELKACVGKTKSVTLTEEVLGTTTHLVRCIGYNCDRDNSDTTKNTLTFQTVNCLNNYVVFSNSSCQWSSSTARTQCQKYYKAFPGKDSIVTVSKKTMTNSTGTSSSYINETVFLPSVEEMNLYQYADGKEWGEYCRYNTSKIGYQYYTSNESRIKNKSDSSSDATTYWLRSYEYNYTMIRTVTKNGKISDAFCTDSERLAPAFAI